MDTPHFLQLSYLYCFLKLTYKLPSSIRLKHSKNRDLLFTAISQMPRRITGLKNLITNAQMDCFYCCLAWWSRGFLTLERIRADWVSLHQRWISALHGGTSHSSLMQGTCDMPTTSKSQQPWMWFLFFSHLPKGNFFQFHTFGSGRFLIKDTLWGNALIPPAPDFLIPSFSPWKEGILATLAPTELFSQRTFNPSMRNNEIWYQTGLCQ